MSVATILLPLFVQVALTFVVLFMTARSRIAAYKARQVTFQTELMGQVGAAGVRVSTVSEDQTPGRRVHDPKHPAADAEGYVTYSNVNPVEEMVNMISASRSYQNNVEVMNTAKTLLLKTIQMGS